MNRELRNKTKEWMALERMTLTQRKAAAEFYDQQLMRLIEKDFIKRNKAQVFERVDYLIVSVGMSYEPIVLNISLLKPRKILFMYTAKSEATLDKIISYCGLRSQSYQKSHVDELNPIDIYKEIKRAYLAWNRPQRLYVDITGGTKAMSSACALAGTMIDMQMVYVSTNDYLVDFRKPNPGSEELSYIENPLAVFGDLEVDKAYELFGQYNFAGAAEQLRPLMNRIPDPAMRQQVQFVYLLARAYEAWDALDCNKAYQMLNELYQQMRRDSKVHREFLMMDQLPAIADQVAQLSNMQEITALQQARRGEEILQNKDMIHSLMFTMYQNAETRRHQGKLDMSTLLLYRLFEMIEQRRLIAYNLYVSRPQYADMIIPGLVVSATAEERQGWLQTRYTAITARLFRNAGKSYLPSPIALLDGYMLLAALGDPIIIGRNDKETVANLSQIRSKVYLRNNSIFAHGLGPVSESDYEKFRRLVEETFRRFCEIEGIDYEIEYRKSIWINPMDSSNYMKTGEN